MTEYPQIFYGSLAEFISNAGRLIEGKNAGAVSFV